MHARKGTDQLQMRELVKQLCKMKEVGLVCVCVFYFVCH